MPFRNVSSWLFLLMLLSVKHVGGDYEHLKFTSEINKRSAWTLICSRMKLWQTSLVGVWWDGRPADIDQTKPLERRLRRHLVFPTWGGSVPIEQVVVLGGVEVHDDASSIQQLLVAAGAGDAVVAVSAVASVVQLLRLHLATRRYPEW